MLKKLDKLVLKAYLGPFTLTFAVVVFILLTQYMLKYFEEFVGKNLGIAVFAELLFYFSINMVPVAMPLAVLLSALIAFGNLGEFNELTAIKTSGVTLMRVIAPVFLVVIAISLGLFFFNDQVVPRANLKAYSLLYDIRQKKPALDIKPGIFYNGLPGYSVKVNDRDQDGKTLKDIMIYDHTAGRGNVSLILADSGLMYTMYGERYLVLELWKGQNYSELVENDPSGEEFVRNRFQHSKLMFSLASFDMNRTQVELFSQNRMMRNVIELNRDIDSMGRDKKNLLQAIPSNMSSYFNYLFRPAVVNDTGKPVELVTLNDSSFLSAATIAANQARNVKGYTMSFKERVSFINRESNTFQVELSKKYTQSMACLVLFLIGAPLGAIIRKGGLGIPVLISIAFFVVYYVLTITGEKWAKEGIFEVGFSMWYANAILLVFGLFFLNQARRDAAIFEIDFYRNLFAKKRRKPLLKQV